MDLKLIREKTKTIKTSISYRCSRKHYKSRCGSRWRHIHIMIKLDKPCQHYYSTETGSRQGKVVTEAICQIPAQYTKAIVACNGAQQNFFKIPPTGTHVFITGSYVLDAENNWRNTSCC